MTKQVYTCAIFGTNLGEKYQLPKRLAQSIRRGMPFDELYVSVCDHLREAGFLFKSTHHPRVFLTVELHGPRFLTVVFRHRWAESLDDLLLQSSGIVTVTREERDMILHLDQEELRVAEKRGQSQSQMAQRTHREQMRRLDHVLRHDVVLTLEDKQAILNVLRQTGTIETSPSERRTIWNVQMRLLAPRDILVLHDPDLLHLVDVQRELLKQRANELLKTARELVASASTDVPMASADVATSSIGHAQHAIEQFHRGAERYASHLGFFWGAEEAAPARLKMVQYLGELNTPLRKLVG